MLDQMFDQVFDQVSRRRFVKGSLSAAGCLALARVVSRAYPLGIPMGFQIYGLRNEAAGDFSGVLKKTASVGYQAVELCSFHSYKDFAPIAGMKPAEIKKVVEDAGLRCESCHFNAAEFADATIDSTLEWANGVGLKYVILSAAKQKPEMTMDDWKQNFDLMNQYGARVKKAGMQFGYHTHGMEWKRFDGVMVFDALLKAVDPKLVQGQLDLGGVVMGGVDPASYIQDHPGRLCSLHLKDVKTGQTTPGSWPLGQGNIDWKAVFAAAKIAGIRNYSVEMEVRPPIDPFEALKDSAAYLKDLNA